MVSDCIFSVVQFLYLLHMHVHNTLCDIEMKDWWKLQKFESVSSVLKLIDELVSVLWHLCLVFVLQVLMQQVYRQEWF